MTAFSFPGPFSGSPGTGAVRVWLACGATDMRKGFDGLAVLAQQVLEQSQHPARCSRSGASAAIWSSCCGTAVRAFACFPSGWIAVGSSGQPRRRARCTLPRRSFRCSLQASTGVTPSERQRRYWQDKSARFAGFSSHRNVRYASFAKMWKAEAVPR